jgi:hypothetical protein
VLDSNGKVQKNTNLDDAAAKRREVQSRIAEFEFADRNSDVFSVSLAGLERVGDRECYVVRIDNSINDDSHSFYINADNFHLEKTYIREAEYDRERFLSDYREVDGLLVPFHTEETTHPVEQTEAVTITKYESNPTIERTLFEPPEDSKKDYEFVSGHSAEDIPFSLIGNHLYIPVKINGKERLWILDTGAGMSVIQAGFAKELGLELKGNLTGRGAGGNVEASFTELPPFSLKGIRFDRQVVAVIDMHELISRVGLDFAGILGFDFLSRFVTKVDYTNELVSFYDPETFEYTGEGHIVGGHLENNVFEVPATLDGEYSGNWLFDLGASLTGLDGAYAYINGFVDRPGIERLGHGAGNEYRMKAVTFRSLEFAGYTIDKPRISFPIGGTDPEFRAERIGVLGNNIYRNFVLYIDYARERIIVEKGGDFNEAFPVDRSGLQLRLGEGSEIVVLNVSDKTPAMKAGLQVGDVIRAVNGIDAENLDGIVAIREMLKGEPGTDLAFVVNREGKDKRLTVTLEDLP